MPIDFFSKKEGGFQMKKVTKTITINAPTHKVFEYMGDPNNLPEIWPSLIETRDVQLSPAGEIKSWNWSYKMAGMRFEGSSEVLEQVPEQLSVTKSKGGIDSTITWKYMPEKDGTKVTVETEYTVPIPLLGKLAESFIVKQNEKEAEIILENLKARMET
jgi:uncharacterized membrane protein